MSKGIVYILTNPCLEGWVKIGKTSRNDIAQRLSELNTPANIPLSFRAYALYHVNDPDSVERDIHELIDMIDDSLHARETLASGRIRQREFFRISPEKAYLIFQKVSKFRGDCDCLDMVTATPEEQEETEISDRKQRFSFKLLGIPVGSELAFIKDDTITCTVLDDKNHVEYEGETTTTSALASLLLDGNNSNSYQGPRYFAYEGEVLFDRRRRMEDE